MELDLNEILKLPGEVKLLALKLDGVMSAIKSATTPKEENDGWIDAKAAMSYLGMSKNTFEKYRNKMHGFRVGGKFYYKKKDLDSFVKLWEVNQYHL